jgi:hypothetical protein
MTGRRGRPRREAAERSDERVVSYFTKSEKAKLRKLAEKDKCSIAELVRSLVADRLEVA